MKIGLIERLGSADDDPVVAKQEPAHRRDKGDHPDEAEPKFAFEDLSFTGRSRDDLHGYLFPAAAVQRRRRSAAPVWLQSRRSRSMSDATASSLLPRPE